MVMTCKFHMTCPLLFLFILVIYPPKKVASFLKFPSSKFEISSASHQVQETFQDILQNVKGIFQFPISKDVSIDVGYELGRLPDAISSLGVTKTLHLEYDDYPEGTKYEGEPAALIKLRQLAGTAELSLSGDFHLQYEKFSWSAKLVKGCGFISVHQNKVMKWLKLGVGRCFFQNRLQMILYPTISHIRDRAIPFRQMVPQSASSWSPGINLGSGEFCWDYMAGFPQHSAFEGAGIRIHWRAGEKTSLNIKFQDARIRGMLLTTEFQIPLDDMMATKVKFQNDFQCPAMIRFSQA